MSRFFDYFFEVIGWIKIAASPLLIGMAIGGAIYLYSPTPVGFNIGVFCTAIGLFVGIFWASRIWHTEGTTSFLARFFSTSDSYSKKTEGRGK